MKSEITSGRIIVRDGDACYSVSLDEIALDCGGNEAGTFREALAAGLPIWCVDDHARGQSSYGMHGALYIGAHGHTADHRVY